MAVTLTVENGIGHVTIDNPPVNAAGHTVRSGLTDVLNQTEMDAAITAVVLSCAGQTFVAGADVREFDKPARDPLLPDVVLTLEGATKPWVAAIHGTALGGGLEIALGCHYRVAVASAKLGLPEVNLGILPGAGGTVRLPRLISPEPALDMITSGKPVSAKRAFELGLVDRVFDDDLVAQATRFAQSVADAPLPKPLAQCGPNTPEDPEAWTGQKENIQRKARGQNAPVAAMGSVEFALAHDATEALAFERAQFNTLKADPQSEALRHIFFAERAASKLDEIKGVAPRPLTAIGVVGGGTMGAGIAAAHLLAGLEVVMVERDAAAAAAGRSRTHAILDGSLKRGLISEDKHRSITSAFVASDDYGSLSNADLVIEAVFEDMAVKHAVFAELERTTKPEAILASNTSYLDVNTIAQAVADPSRVIGLHFFSPAHIMKLLELVIPDTAVPDVIATGAALGKRLRKITVPTGVCDGFIGNRIMSTYRRECDYMAVDGAPVEQIDQAMRAFGFPMGIFQMQDLAGLDIGWANRKRLAPTRDPSERYVTVSDQLCEMGRFGRKAGRGFYIYEDGKTPRIDPEVTALFEAEAKAQGIVRKPTTDEAIMTRILEVMQSESEAILREGIARRADDIDVVMTAGYGFPRHKGGPMYLRGQ